MSTKERYSREIEDAIGKAQILAVQGRRDGRRWRGSLCVSQAGRAHCVGRERGRDGREYLARHPAAGRRRRSGGKTGRTPKGRGGSQRAGGPLNKAE